MIKVPVTVTAVRVIFYENNKYYSQVFLAECLFSVCNRCHELSVEHYRKGEKLKIKKIYTF